MTVVAVDPGEHVGIAWRDEPGLPAHTYMIHNDMPRAWENIRDLAPDVLIVERFATAGRMSNHGLRTIECVGSMQCLAWMLGALLVMHTPQQRYPMQRTANEMLRRQKNITTHHKDALAHLLIWEYQHDLRKLSTERTEAMK